MRTKINVNMKNRIDIGDRLQTISSAVTSAEERFGFRQKRKGNIVSVQDLQMSPGLSPTQTI